MKMIKKTNLPARSVSFVKPFVWRKKWKSVWNEVRFCSQKCKREFKQLKSL